MQKLILLTLFITCFALSPVKFTGHKVYTLTITTEEQQKVLDSFYHRGLVDVWTEGRGSNNQVDVRVPPEHRENFLRFLNQKNIPYTVFIEDVQKMIDREAEELSKIPPFVATQQDPRDFFKSYRTLNETFQWLRTIVDRYPQLASVHEIGRSFEGRPLVALKIEGNRGSKKPAIIYNGCIHAREWISPMTVMFIAHELLTKYTTNSTVKSLVDNFSWHFIPHSNPDGYEYTKIDRMWRKTRTPNRGSSCIGTDPNRNWDYHWAERGASNNPCSDAYHGPSPFSEREVLAVANYAQKTENLKLFIDWHAYSQLWMRPWGYTKTAPPHEQQMAALGEKAVRAIRNKHRKVYENGRIAVIIYEASGSSADWVYGKLGAYAYGVELRPDRNDRRGFAPGPEEIIPTGEESFEATVAIAQSL